jgi:hypothetical protein
VKFVDKQSEKTFILKSQFELFVLFSSKYYYVNKKHPHATTALLQMRMRTYGNFFIFFLLSSKTLIIQMRYNGRMKFKNTFSIDHRIDINGKIANYNLLDSIFFSSSFDFDYPLQELFIQHNKASAYQNC